MAAAFRPVNTSLATDALTDKRMTSILSAPPSAAISSAPATHRPHLAMSTDEAATAVRSTFNILGPRHLPPTASPVLRAAQVLESAERLRSDSTHRTAKSSNLNSTNVKADESDGDAGGAEETAASEEDSVTADGQRSNKKKKSQRFYCTDYPPCNLSFTRSEHLARHIRKHTGERPFQCHCSRRFSRLDNLRQHAQTVHVNEDIPIDSLAASGSRFQRQIRLDRTRQAGHRARASTGGSAGGPARGHSKSLSTSSIASISSLGSPYVVPAGIDPRPAPLFMTSDPQPIRPSPELYRHNADSSWLLRLPSSSDFSAPTSATFSTAQSSPRWPSGLTSPTFSHSRSHSMATAGSRTPPGRRLSVPSAPNPFQAAAHGQQTHGRPGMPVPAVIVNPHAAPYPTSDTAGMGLPPQTTSSAWPSRRESAAPSAADEAWRRRTWHPDSRSYNGGQSTQLGMAVNQSVRPNPPPPIANPPKTQLSGLRLPGIESFDPIPRRPASPMDLDAEPGYRTGPYAPQIPVETIQLEERRNLNMYDAGLQRGLTRLDLGRKTPPRHVFETGQDLVQGQSLHHHQQHHHHHHHHSQAVSSSLMATPKEDKRRGWHHGPMATHSQASSQVAPMHSVGPSERLVHPNLDGFRTFPSRDQAVQPSHQDRSGKGDPLRRLEALVAVATSEGSTAAAY